MADPESNILHESPSDSGTQLAEGGEEVTEQKPGSSIFDSAVIFRRATPEDELNSGEQDSNILEETSSLSQVPLHKQLQAEAESGEEIPVALPVAAEVPVEPGEDKTEELPQVIVFRSLKPESPADPAARHPENVAGEESAVDATDELPGFEPAEDIPVFAGFEPAGQPAAATGEKSTYRPRQRQNAMPLGSLILAVVLGPITVWVGWMIYHAVIDQNEPAPTAQESEKFELDATPFKPLEEDDVEGGFRPGARNENEKPKFRTFKRGNFLQAAPDVDLPEPEVKPDADVVAASQEKQARQRYRQTLKLIKTDPNTARVGLEEIIRRYPATSTAEQARLQLATLQRE